jgi:hypothetical protein
MSPASQPVEMTPDATLSPSMRQWPKVLTQYNSRGVLERISVYAEDSSQAINGSFQLGYVNDAGEVIPFSGSLNLQAGQAAVITIEEKNRTNRISLILIDENRNASPTYRIPYRRGRSA